MPVNRDALETIAAQLSNKMGRVLVVQSHKFNKATRWSIVGLHGQEIFGFVGCTAKTLWERMLFALKALQLAQPEVKLDQPLPPPNEVEIELLKRGEKIGAIKAYRSRCSTGIKEAKDAVEAYALAHDLWASSDGRMYESRKGWTPEQRAAVDAMTLNRH